MSYIIRLNPDRCTACGACVVACQDEKGYSCDALRVCRVFEENEEMLYSSVSCLHCKNAACMEVCPAHCFVRDESTGFVVYDNSQCVGCHACENACAFDAIRFDKEGKMQKCDGCNERVLRGQEPACVRICPTGALIFNKL